MGLLTSSSFNTSHMKIHHAEVWPIDEDTEAGNLRFHSLNLTMMIDITKNRPYLYE